MARTGRRRKPRVHHHTSVVKRGPVHLGLDLALGGKVLSNLGPPDGGALVHVDVLVTIGPDELVVEPDRVHHLVDDHARPLREAVRLHVQLVPLVVGVAARVRPASGRTLLQRNVVRFLGAGHEPDAGLRVELPDGVVEQERLQLGELVPEHVRNDSARPEPRLERFRGQRVGLFALRKHHVKLVVVLLLDRQARQLLFVPFRNLGAGRRIRTRVLG